MPSEAQFKELIDGCEIKYFYHSDSYELIFVADNGNYIRLESKGYKEPNSSYIYSSYGKYYWTSTASQEYRYYAKALYGEFQYLLYYKLGESDFDKVVRSYSVEMRMPIRAVTAK